MKIRLIVLNGLMGDYFRRIARFFALVATVPFLVAYIGAWSAGLGFILFLLALPAGLLALVVGAVAWFVQGYQRGKEERATRDKVLIFAGAPVLFAATICLSWPLFALGSYAGTMSRLMLNRGNYEAIIAKARSNPKPAWFQDDGGVTYSIDVGPPVRVAFNPEGMLDNWSGIIYDSTGDVMLADGFDLRPESLQLRSESQSYLAEIL
ncbi:hypothetical protein [Sphingomonas sp. PB4P5]|uniref:hypothetical protein n=1 Tax=Parasphingomonas puruogangriensis TaxID=3096155 RepID=UPI002FC9FFF6